MSGLFKDSCVRIIFEIVMSGMVFKIAVSRLFYDSCVRIVLRIVF